MKKVFINGKYVTINCKLNGVKLAPAGFDVNYIVPYKGIPELSIEISNALPYDISSRSSKVNDTDKVKNNIGVSKKDTEITFNSGVLVTPPQYFDFLDPDQELPANLVQFADQKIIELISIPSDEQSLTAFKTRYLIPDDKWIECIAIKKAYEDEKLILTSRKEGCTSCALGGLNRKYMKKLLPYLASEENMKFLYDAYLTLTFAEQLTDEQIEKSIQSKELQSIAKSIKKELVDRVNQKDENGNPVRACTSCEANRIKAKYIAMVKSVFDIVKQNWK